uniref:polynucleotide 5'-hydroxyl-kinase n=1 Tax=Archaeoglobus fulgidus TaxID=2234 RepID=A0A7C3VG57_ARCFL
MRVEKGKTVIAKGKVRIEGKAEVCGASIPEFFTEKFVPIYCLEDSEIYVEGDYRIVEGCTIPESWKKLAKMDWEVLFLYGGVDTGKSTLATFLANKLGGCYILDLDIGQSELLHPGAMGYGFAKNCVNLSQAEYINGYFAGVISPMGREVKCIRGVARLWKELRKLEGRKIVNTTGWVRGKRALDYKLAKLEIINPDIVAAFDDADLENWSVYRVESGEVVERSREERARIRMEKYRKELEGSKPVLVDRSKVSGRFFNGKRIIKDFMEEVLGVSIREVRRGDDFLLIITERRFEVNNSIIESLKTLYGVEDIYIVSEDEIKGLVVGLYSGNRYLGLGVVRELGENEFLIETRHTDFDKIVLGEFGIGQEKEYMLRLP